MLWQLASTDLLCARMPAAPQGHERPSSEMLIRYTLRTLNDSTRLLMKNLYDLALAYAPAINNIVQLICLLIAKHCGVLPQLS
ncbi:hypothetical protein PGO46_21080 [Klebsiella aerogenes]